MPRCDGVITWADEIPSLKSAGFKVGKLKGYAASGYQAIHNGLGFSSSTTLWDDCPDAAVVFHGISHGCEIRMNRRIARDGFADAASEFVAMGKPFLDAMGDLE